jgi:hypothetical protein
VRHRHYCLTLDSKPARAARSLIALLSSSYALGHTASADLRIGVFARLCGLLGSAQAGGGSDESPSLAVVCMALAVVLPPRALVRRPADSDARVRPAAYLPVDQVSAERLRAIEAGAGLGTDGRDEARRERSAIEAIALLGLSEAHSALLIASVNDAAESIRTLDGMAASEAQPRRIALETFLALCARTRWEALGARTHELRELFRGTANLTLGLLIRYEQFGELIRSLNATFAQDAVAEMHARERGRPARASPSRTPPAARRAASRASAETSLRTPCSSSRHRCPPPLPSAGTPTRCSRRASSHSSSLQTTTLTCATPTCPPPAATTASCRRPEPCPSAAGLRWRTRTRSCRPENGAGACCSTRARVSRRRARAWSSPRPRRSERLPSWSDSTRMLTFT